MKLPRWIRTLGDEGLSAIEVSIGAWIFSALVLGALAATSTSQRMLASGQRETSHSVAIEYQTETFRHIGHDALASGSAVVDGHPMRWEVTGSRPKRILLLVETRDVNYQIVEDSLVLFLADRAP